MHTSITSAHTVHFFLIENLQASKHKIHHFQIDTIFNPANRRKEFTVLFFLLTMHHSASTNSF